MLNYQRVKKLWYWLVVSNMNFIFHTKVYGMSSFPLTNSYFSRWLLHHQPGYIVIIFIDIHLLSPGICETFIDLHCFLQGIPIVGQLTNGTSVDESMVDFCLVSEATVMRRSWEDTDQGWTQLVQRFGYGSIPINSYFDVHQGYKVLTHCHLNQFCSFGVAETTKELSRTEGCKML